MIYPRIDVGRTLIVAFATILMLAGMHSESGASPEDDQTERGPVAYLFVIDRSGSMDLPSELEGHEHQTRWQVVHEQLLKFASDIRLGRKIWVLTFAGDSYSFPLRPRIYHPKTEVDRERMLEDLRNIKPPDFGLTPYYEALQLAYEYASHLSEAHPNREIWMLVYSDGVHRFPASTLTLADVEANIRNLHQRQGNLRIFKYQIGPKSEPLLVTEADQEFVVEGTNDPRTPFAITVSLSEDILESPALPGGQAQSVTLNLTFENLIATRYVEGKSVGLRFVPEATSPIDVTLSPATFPLSEGSTEITLRVNNASVLDPTEIYRGHLHLNFPEIDDHEVVAPRNLPITFSKASAFIFSIRPAEGSNHPTARPIVFRAETTPGASILWEFGDGSSLAGHQVSHTYYHAGEYTVNLEVSMPDGSPGVAQSIPIRVIDLGVEVNRPVILVEGTTTTLTLTPRGSGIESFEWWVDGMRLDADGEMGETARYAFPRPGEYRVSARARHPLLTVVSPELFVDVRPLPRLEIVEPPSEVPLRFDRMHRFLLEAEAGGLLGGITWEISSDDGASVLATHTSPLASHEGELQRSEYNHRVSGSDFGEADTTLQVTARGEYLDRYTELNIPPVIVTRDYQFAYPYPEGRLQTDSTQRYARPATFRIESDNEIRRVTWDFGDGTTLQSGTSTQHTYDRHTGDYEVTATIEGRGGKTSTLTANLSVVAEPVVPTLRVEDQSGEVVTGKVGSSVRLVDGSSGDVVRREFYHNGKLLPDGEDMVTLVEGANRFELRVFGPTARGVDSPQARLATVTVEGRFPPNPLIFIVPGILMFLVWLFLAKLLLGNQARGWTLEGWVGQRGDAEARRFSSFVRASQHYDRWKKRAEIPLKNLFVGKQEVEGSKSNTDVLHLEATSANGPVLKHPRENKQGMVNVQLKKTGDTLHVQEYCLRDPDIELPDDNLMLIDVDKKKNGGVGDTVLFVIVTALFIGLLATIIFNLDAISNQLRGGDKVVQTETTGTFPESNQE